MKCIEMNLKFATATLISILGILPQASAAELPIDTVKAIDHILHQKIKENGPGCSVGVLQNGTISYERQFGQSDVGTPIHLSPQSRFELSSTSKQFTATAIALLVLDGRLSLDEPITRYLPEFGAPLSAVQINHLVHHTSGLPDYLDLAEAAGVPDARLDEPRSLALLLSHQKLKFTPGKQDDYSNSNYFLLSLIVKRVSGQSLAQFAQDRIFGPLGMSDTRFLDERGGAWPLNLAHGYSKIGGHLTQDDVFSPIVGDGGVITTVRDLARWDANFYANLLGHGDQLITLLRTPGRLNSGELTDYGFGLVLHRRNGLSWERHAGEYRGYNSEFIRYPQKQLSVIVLCNRSDVDASGIAETLVSILTNRVSSDNPLP